MPILGEICQNLAFLGEISKKSTKMVTVTPQNMLQGCVMAQNDRIDEFFQKQ